MLFNPKCKILFTKDKKHLFHNMKITTNENNIKDNITGITGTVPCVIERVLGVINVKINLFIV